MPPPLKGMGRHVKLVFSVHLSKAPTISRLNGFVSIFIHKRLRYCLPFNRNDHIVLQNFLTIACNHGFLAHLSQSDRVSFCDRFSSGVLPASVNFYFKCHLLINHKANFIQTSQECSFGGHLLKLFKEFNSMQNSGCHGNRKKKL
jgi:hypothetical protein